jgi:hypothetical protein
MKPEYENKLLSLYYRATKVMSREEMENIPILVDIGNDIFAHHFNLYNNDVQMSYEQGQELPSFPLRSLSEDLVDIILDSVEIDIYDAEKEKESR